MQYNIDLNWNSITAFEKGTHSNLLILFGLIFEQVAEFKKIICAAFVGMLFSCRITKKVKYRAKQQPSFCDFNSIKSLLIYNKFTLYYKSLALIFR